MGPLRSSLALAAMLFAAPATAQTVSPWRSYIDEASSRFGVPASWIERVIRAESGGRTHLDGRPIRSSAGAMGLMQLMPGTWAEMQARLGLGDDPDHPRDNILAGTFYLRLMYERFGYPGLFAAYNAGPGRYAEHLAGGRALPRETVGYLVSVAPTMPAPTAISARPSPPATIFAVRRDMPAAGVEPENNRAPTSLFVVLSQGR